MDIEGVFCRLPTDLLRYLWDWIYHAAASSRWGICLFRSCRLAAYIVACLLFSPILHLLLLDISYLVSHCGRVYTILALPPATLPSLYPPTYPSTYPRLDPVAWMVYTLDFSLRPACGGIPAYTLYPHPLRSSDMLGR